MNSYMPGKAGDSSVSHASSFYSCPQSFISPTHSVCLSAYLFLSLSGMICYCISSICLSSDMSFLSIIHLNRDVRQNCCPPKWRNLFWKGETSFLPQPLHGGLDYPPFKITLLYLHFSPH